ncbi:serine carboxypeptidase-like 40 [Cynara cardunculus var. scolymus]|uniref:Carboxypeptidase n=1 Tax=Cynara cardunculus var. scolymus TaxID=59895 RepID=A0A103Y1H7_CYNCS|nr:serine carboxypeptidase-like 40 [Cynara cardunculus var. scolymus]KVI00809.1 Peptidase S10, serine carboxypeptidase [Cynara cardunculus var. scolymus]
MANKTLLVLFLFLSACSFIHGNKQLHSLVRFYKAKMSKDGTVNTTSHFEPVQHLHNSATLIDHGAQKENDKIKKLPGQPYVKFDQYGGYVTINESAGRAFYYYFVEAENPKKSSSLPLLLWLNGGPGCSSLAYGAMQELGPFRVNSDGKTLYRNKFSWNRAANVLFLESPAGVGFSYSNTSSDYKNGGDKSTAADNYVFLLNWLERFPEYKGRDLYLSGESYAGHYVPQLAHTIIYHNIIANKTLINLKGILIGNAVINDETDTMGMYDYFGSHALISDETSYDIRKYCNFSADALTQPDKCIDATTDADYNIEVLDIYNIYAPLCFDGNLTIKPKKMSWQNIDPCSDYYTYAYMNRRDVQDALHANVTKLDHDWEPCSEILKGWHDSAATVIPLLKEFMKYKLRVWIFSGDTDARVPVTSTKYSISSMKLPIKTKWHPWIHQGEAGGFVQVYKGDLTLATVRGAGHQVPSYQPKRALALVKHFLSGKPLKDSSRPS